jgi:large subunit ribosomal protein L9
LIVPADLPKNEGSETIEVCIQPLPGSLKQPGTIAPIFFKECTTMAVEIILFDNVRNLGRMGDVVRVAPGYFRNYLRPKGLADLASEGNKARFEKMKAKTMALNAERLDQAQQAAAALSALEGLKIAVKAADNGRLFGSVTPQDVVDAVGAAGMTIERKQVEIKEPIKEIGDYVVGIRVHADVVAEIKLSVVRA